MRERFYYIEKYINTKILQNIEHFYFDALKDKHKNGICL